MPIEVVLGHALAGMRHQRFEPGQQLYDYYLEQLAGPVAGIFGNTAKGLKEVGDGHTWRGIETMLPTSVKSGAKALRYLSEGANTLRGDPLVTDVSLRQVVAQAAGFTPAEIAERYAANSAMKNVERALFDRRQQHMNAYAMAVQTKDVDAVRAVTRCIVEWNRKHPELAITTKSLRQSLQVRQRYSDNASGGVAIDKRVRQAPEWEAGFAR